MSMKLSGPWRAAVVLAAVMCLGAIIPQPASAQDYAAGVTAFDRGDFNTAFTILRGLAEKGNPKALHWFQMGAARGAPRIQFELARMYLAGRGVPKDEALAARWFGLAAQQGYRPAQYALARMYLKGRGVPRDVPRAVAWLRPAAEKGYTPAQLLLSRIYFAGRGVTQNTALSLAWLKRAARGGNASAMHQLGYWYSRGIVVKQNYLLAHVWFNLAAAAGYPRAAKDRAWVAQFLTRKQIKRAQAMAQGMKSGGGR